MSLKDQLLEEMKQAMKAKDQVKLGVIRLLRSDIKNFEIDHGEADDQAVQKIAKSLVKKWQEAIEEFKQGDRQDLVDETQAKIAVVKEYLPEELSADEIKQTIEEVMAQTQADQPGPVIGQVMAKLGAQADGKQVAQLVNQAFKQK